MLIIRVGGFKKEQVCLKVVFRSHIAHAYFI